MVDDEKESNKGRAEEERKTEKVEKRKMEVQEKTQRKRWMERQGEEGRLKPVLEGKIDGGKRGRGGGTAVFLSS